MRIHFFQNESYENPGYIAVWAAKNGHSVGTTYLYEKGVLPVLAELDMLVIMGGSMNVYEDEKFPWLADEKLFIRAAIDAGKIVIGICLGAQLIASILGGRVFKNTYKEIGWFPITMSHQILDQGVFAGFPQELMAFHWHGDTFELPPQSKRFAFSECTLNQGFRAGNNVFGFQFHLECMEDNIRKFVAEGADEIRAGGQYVQEAESILKNCAHAGKMNRFFEKFLDKIAAKTNTLTQM